MILDTDIERFVQLMPAMSDGCYVFVFHNRAWAEEIEYKFSSTLASYGYMTHVRARGVIECPGKRLVFTSADTRDIEMFMGLEIHGYYIEDDVPEDDGAWWRGFLETRLRGVYTERERYMLSTHP